MKQQAESGGLIRQEEDILTYILYPQIAPSFLKGERKAEEIPKKLTEKVQSAEFPASMEVEVDGEIFNVRIVSVEGSAVGATISAPGVREKIPRGHIEGGIKSNMQGMVLKVPIRRGATVKKGDTLLILEAMKMENAIHSQRDGKVTEIFVDVGDVVQNGDILMIME